MNSSDISGRYRYGQGPSSSYTAQSYRRRLRQAI